MYKSAFHSKGGKFYCRASNKYIRLLWGFFHFWPPGSKNYLGLVEQIMSYWEQNGKNIKELEKGFSSLKRLEILDLEKCLG